MIPPIEVPWILKDEELVVVKREDSDLGDTLLRAFVTDVKGSEVTVFALDTAERLAVPLSHLRPFTTELTRVLFKAIPCSFFGISAMKEKFAETAFRLLRWANSNAEVKVKLISFDGFFNLVQVFIAEGMFLRLILQPVGLFTYSFISTSLFANSNSGSVQA